MRMSPVSVRGGKRLTKVTSAQQLRKIKQQAHVVLKEKILQKLTMTKEEDCQVLNLLDMREQICQFKEHLTRIIIMA